VPHFGKERIQWLCIGLMQSIADMHVLRTSVAHGSSGLHFFYVDYVVSDDSIVKLSRDLFEL